MWLLKLCIQVKGLKLFTICFYSSFRSSCNKCSTAKGEKGESAPVRTPYQRREGRATTPNGTLLGENHCQVKSQASLSLVCVQVLHLHPRDVAEVILALHNAGEGHHQESGEEGRPQERGKGGKVVPALRPRDTGDEEAPQLLRGLGEEALMRVVDRKVQSTREKMIRQLLLLHPSN